MVTILKTPYCTSTVSGYFLKVSPFGKGVMRMVNIPKMIPRPGRHERHGAKALCHATRPLIYKMVTHVYKPQSIHRRDSPPGLLQARIGQFLGLVCGVDHKPQYCHWSQIILKTNAQGRPTESRLL